MKTTLLFLAALSSFVAAQNLPGEPPCATACLSSAIDKVCQPSDVACQCGPAGQSSIAGLVAPCLLSACGTIPGALETAQAVGSQLCSEYFAAVNATTTSTMMSSAGAGNLSSVSTTSVTAKTTSVPATITTAATTAGSSSAPAAVSTAGAEKMVAGVGCVVGILIGAVAAL